jgi:hypothetical protein
MSLREKLITEYLEARDMNRKLNNREWAGWVLYLDSEFPASHFNIPSRYARHVREILEQVREEEAHAPH